MDFWIRSVRYIILSGSVILAGLVFLWVQYVFPESRIRLARLDEIYALVAIAFLYITLLATPLTQAFPNLPFRAVYIKARRALGVSAFVFGLIHASISFFVLLGGFPGIFALEGNDFVAVFLGLAALLILSLLAATSMNFMVRRLGSKWKPLHRLVYLAAVFILIHGTLLGTQLGNPLHPVAWIVYGAVAFLLVLEGLRVYRFFQKKYLASPPPSTLSGIQ